VASGEKPLEEKGKKGKVGTSVSFFQNLFHGGLYKRNQGRITRQVTFAVIVITFALGAWRMSESASSTDWTWKLIIPTIIFTAGTWFAYRLVNLPTFTDFLISVEAEMSKVSWPTRTELIRGSIVVLITIIFLALFLFLFDLMWNFIFQALEVVPKADK
jgi:preprotein translocase subunit SecE